MNVFGGVAVCSVLCAFLATGGWQVRIYLKSLPSDIGQITHPYVVIVFEEGKGKPPHSFHPYNNLKAFFIQKRLYIFRNLDYRSEFW